MSNTTEFQFTLTQKAKSKGGDKYTCTTDESFSVYVPQTTSRSTSVEPTQNLVVTISNAKVNGFQFTLTQKAKSKGGDKYTCVSDESFSIYVPQSTSRSNIEPIQEFTLVLQKPEALQNAQEPNSEVVSIIDIIEYDDEDEECEEEVEEENYRFPIVSDLEFDPDDIWHKLPEKSRPVVIFDETDCASGGSSGMYVYRDSKGKVLYTKKSPKKGTQWDASIDLMRNEESERSVRKWFRQFEIAYLLKKYKDDKDLFEFMSEWLSCL